jgi:hypothetical protein
MVRNFEADDKGKRVVTADGDMVGTVERVSGSSAHIEPENDLSQSVRRRLGWSEEGEETYRLRKSKVDSITDDEIQLKRNL